MQLGQKSVLHFVSKIGATVAGFIATIYFARFLGADILGSYFLVIAVFTWLKMFSTMGISKAVNKRISETNESDEFFTAGSILQVASISIVSICIFTFQDYFISYTGFNRIILLVLLIGAGSLFSFVTSVLVGERLAHIAGALNPVDRIVRTIAQIGFVVLGFEVVGMIFGYIIASLVSVAIGSYYISTRFVIPERKHFYSIWNYAKFSWIGRMSNRTLASMDTVVLGFFVTSNFIGIYEIAWSIASVLAVFGGSINQTLFPELSRVDTKDSSVITDLAQTGVTYAGIFLIPGLIGGAILGEVILGVYGSDFRKGYFILVLLIFARLVSTYKDQFTNVIDAINKPKITFKINVVFVVMNISLNLILVYLYGWIGAAVATLGSAFVGTILAYIALRRLIEFRLPIYEISKQAIAAGIMGIIVYLGAEYVSYSMVPSLILIVIGGIVYFIILAGISSEFRNIVENNLPKTIDQYVSLFR